MEETSLVHLFFQLKALEGIEIWSLWLDDGTNPWDLVQGQVPGICTCVCADLLSSQHPTLAALNRKYLKDIKRMQQPLFAF